MAAGFQGACHFWLALHTEGFSSRSFTLSYDVLRASDGKSTGSEGSTRAMLSARTDAPKMCALRGFSVFLYQPWNFDDERVRLPLSVSDEDDRTATLTREVMARGPEDGPSGDRSQWCGFREWPVRGA